MGWAEKEYAALPRIESRDPIGSVRFAAAYDLKDSLGDISSQARILQDQVETILHEIELGGVQAFLHCGIADVARRLELAIHRFTEAQEAVVRCQREDEKRGGFQHEDPHALRIEQKFTPYKDGRGAKRHKRSVQALCICGWTSDWHEKDKDAQKQHAVHVKEQS